MFISFEFVNARSEPQKGRFCPFQLQLFARFIKSLNFYRKKQWNSLIMHNLQWTPAHNIVVTCVSICIQLYSLPKRWGRMCCVAQEDFPEGSRCSFIQLSNRVEQRKRNWKSRGRRVEGEKKKKELQHRMKERMQARWRIRWMWRRRGKLVWAPCLTLP